MSLQKISDIIFNLKEKISDEEYKNIMEHLGEIYTHTDRYAVPAPQSNYSEDSEDSEQELVEQVLDSELTNRRYMRVHYRTIGVRNTWIKFLPLWISKFFFKDIPHDLIVFRSSDIVKFGSEEYVRYSHYINNNVILNDNNNRIKVYEKIEIL